MASSPFVTVPALPAAGGLTNTEQVPFHQDGRLVRGTPSEIVEGGLPYATLTANGVTGTVAELLEDAGARGCRTTAIATTAMPARTNVVDLGGGQCAPADPRNTAHRGKLLGLTLAPVLAGGEVTIQGPGPVAGVTGSLPQDADLFISDGTGSVPLGGLTATPPTSGWRQIVGRMTGPSALMYQPGEAVLIGEDGDAIVLREGGFAYKAARSDLIALSDNAWISPADVPAALRYGLDTLPFLPADPADYPPEGGLFREGDANGYRIVALAPGADVPPAAAGDSSLIDTIRGGAPSSLDTLGKLAAALAGKMAAGDLQDSVRTTLLHYAGTPLGFTLQDAIKRILPAAAFGMVPSQSWEEAAAGPDQTDAINAYHLFCFDNSIDPEWRRGYYRTDGTVDFYGPGKYRGWQVAKNAKFLDGSTENERGAVQAIRPAPGDVNKYYFEKDVPSAIRDEIKVWGNAIRGSNKLTNVDPKWAGKCVSLDIALNSDQLLGRGPDPLNAIRQGAIFAVNTVKTRPSDFTTDAHLSNVLMSTWKSAGWTDGNIWAETIRNRVTITLPGVILYGPSGGQRGSVVAVLRSATDVYCGQVINLSGSPVSASYTAERCVMINLHMPSSNGLQAVKDNYGINFGLVALASVHAGFGSDQRRDFDAHRCVEITIWGGCWPNGIGAHYVVGLRAFGAVIGSGNPKNTHCLHLAGGNMLLIGCQVTLSYPGGSLFNVREDAFELFGGVIFTGCDLKIVLDGMTEHPTLLNFEPGAAVSDSLRDIEMPANISIDGSNTLRIVDTVPTPGARGVNGARDVFLIKFLKDLGTAQTRKVYTSGRVLIEPQVTFDDGFYTNASGRSRLRAEIVKPHQAAGTGYDITFRGLPGVDVQCNVANNDAVTLNPRHNIRIERCDLPGGGPNQFRYSAGAYRQFQFVDCDGESFQLGGGLAPTLNPPKFQPFGDESRGEVVFVFPASGLWTKPPWAKTVEFTCVGGGGGGGSGRRGAPNSVRTGGGGGGAGGLATAIFAASELPATVSIEVGAGGLGGAALTADDTNGNPGGPGGRSRVVSVGVAILAARGGAGGQGGASGAAPGGLAGAAITLDVGYGTGGSSSGDGGNGGNGVAPQDGLQAGAGAGAGGGLTAANASGSGSGSGFGNLLASERATPPAAGGPAPGGDGTTGAAKPWQRGFGGAGGGGAGGNAAGTVAGGKGGAGAPGGGPGGGGGASANGAASGAGGNGAAGQVWIIARS